MPDSDKHLISNSSALSKLITLVSSLCQKLFLSQLVPQQLSLPAAAGVTRSQRLQGRWGPPANRTTIASHSASADSCRSEQWDSNYSLRQHGAIYQHFSGLLWKVQPESWLCSDFCCHHSTFLSVEVWNGKQTCCLAVKWLMVEFGAKKAKKYQKKLDRSLSTGKVAVLPYINICLWMRNKLKTLSAWLSQN